MKEPKLAKPAAKKPKPAAKPSVPRLALGDLVSQFSYLADSPGFEPIVRAVFAKATACRSQDDSLVVEFGENHELVAGPPAKKIARAWPASFRALMAHHGGLSFPRAVGGIRLGPTVGLEELEDELGDAAEDLLVPIADDSDWWVYHPEDLNTRGEPILCRASHEGGGLEDDRTQLHVGSVFLRRMAEILELRLAIPEGPLAAVVAKGTGLAKGEVIKFKKETLHGSVDDVAMTLAPDGRLIVVRSRSSSTATQVVDVVDFASGPRRLKTIATEVPRSKLWLATEAHRLLIGHTQGYTVVDLESGAMQGFALDKHLVPNESHYYCGPWAMRGDRVVFAHLAVAGLGEGLFVHQVGAPSSAIQRIADLQEASQATQTERSGGWAGANPETSRVFGLFDLDHKLVVVHEDGVTIYDAKSLDQLERSELIPFERPFGRGWSVAALSSRFLVRWSSEVEIVDLIEKSVVPLADDLDVDSVCVHGGEIFVASWADLTIRRFTVDQDGRHEGASSKFKIKHDPTELYVANNLAMVIDEEAGGIVFALEA